MRKILFIAVISITIAACSPKQKPADKEKTPVMVEMTLKVDGMTCDHCEASIATGVNMLAGIDSISANQQDSTAFVRFNASETDLNKIVEAIEGRGFQVAKK